ncbi:hypothetical protein EYF80_055760 [Liparis tanakae]|uniref:Uncharacterized protein n=1 Tax=Liparis tanakae TaxID=230148 RepID=A0A4Z2EYW0_9TELE|nr:hypothetical protein EYF80_055760 [Liparis tanakae]
MAEDSSFDENATQRKGGGREAREREAERPAGAERRLQAPLADTRGCPPRHRGLADAIRTQI